MAHEVEACHAIGLAATLLTNVSVFLQASIGRGGSVKQIRLCWTARVSHLKHEIQTTANWTLATPYLRRDYEIMVQAGNEVFGNGTHWIEERDMPEQENDPSTQRVP